ncbi:unnamed protein product [Orchesella dallaii]|uniref:PABS domain-containing protein n=1 Tax=Orchesella dallaii TaxID=48710 RepID=A0ABP1RKK0_9HEXA
MGSQNLAKSGTILFDFPVPPTDVTDENGMNKVENAVVSVLAPHFGDLKQVSKHEMTSKGGRVGEVRLYVEENNGVTMTIRIYNNNSLVTATLEYDKTVLVDALSYDEIKSLEQKMIKLLNTEKKTKAIPELKRGLKHDIYFNTSDDRILEYDIKKMVYEKQSEFQHVQIAHSENYGNILVLDGLMNLAESDLIYTESLMWRGKVDYKGKHVLILGGGDGALLHELLKEDPAFVTMIDIDDTVMQQCREHLRSACGNTLDTYKTDKYEIIVGDCVAYMKQCIESGSKFDVIFGDLTDIPISPIPQGEIWDFVLEIIKLSFSILKDGGIYMTHANGVSSKESLKTFETAVLGHLPNPVFFKTLENFVPSFMEKWVFYQIREA